MHQYILTKKALDVLKTQENIIELMRLFGKDSRTIKDYLKKENHPAGKLLNLNVRQIIIINSELKIESEIYKRYEH
jgi:hypothetical protein